MQSSNTYALLGLLTIQPMTGYVMKKWVDEVFCHFWRTSYGQIYPTLKKLVEQGLVIVEEKETEKGPASKLYTITEKGTQAVKDWLAVDVYDFNYRDETLLKLYFSTLLPMETVIEKSERTLEYHQGILADYQNMGQDFWKEEDFTRQDLVRYLAVRKGVYLNEARMKWAEECVRLMKQFDDKENNK